MAHSHASGHMVTRTVGTTSGVLLDASEYRIALVVSSPPTNMITLAFGEDAVNKQGIVLYASGSPLILSKSMLGKAICDRVFAISDTAPQTISLMEVTGPVD